MDFFERYIRYREKTESPKVFHRWCAISGIAALLGRQYYLQQGPFRHYPNLYILLMGESGSRKSAAIKLWKPFISAVGYDSFAAEKSSKEQFLIDLATGFDESQQGIEEPRGRDSSKDPTSLNLWGEEVDKTPKEVYVVASEFKEFIGQNNGDFCTTLGDLWDWNDEHQPRRDRFKNSKKIAIWQPTVNILGAITAAQFANVFPPAILEEGFFSRLLLIHGEWNGRFFTRPPEPDPRDTEELVKDLARIRAIIGRTEISDGTWKLLDSIYTSRLEVEDIRFRSYSSRRFTQLLKICLVVSASDLRSSITDVDVIKANTFLSAAERFMPTALGEFGKSKNSDVAQKILEILDKSSKPVTAKEIHKQIHRDIDKVMQLQELLNSLLMAEKVQLTKLGYLPNKKPSQKMDFVDWNYLSEEERHGI